MEDSVEQEEDDSFKESDDVIMNYSERLKLSSLVNEDMEVEDSFGESGDVSLLNCLPVELLIHIFSYLQWYEIVKASQINKMIQNVCNSGTLWSKMYNLDFTKCSEIPSEKVLTVAQQMTNAETLKIDGPTDDLVLDIIRVCPKLKNFWLSNSTFGNLTVEALTRLENIVETLCLSYNQNINSDVIQEFLSEQNGLKKLSLNRCDNIFYLDVKHKLDIPLNLSSISLVGLRLLPENIECLANNCPFLEYLDLSEIKQLTNIAADRVANRFQQLKTLLLTNCSSLMELELLGLSKLEVIDVSYCRRLLLLDVQSDALCKADFSHCFMLGHVKLESLSLIDVNLGHLSSLEMLTLNSSCLRTLNISETKITMEKFLMVQNLGNIEILDINGCQVLMPEDINNKLLPVMSSLKQLNIGSQNWPLLNLSSESLSRLNIMDIKHLSAVYLNMPNLEYLDLDNCQDLTEDGVVDGIIFGKQLKKSKQPSEDFFESGHGLPNLKTLKLSKMQCIEGRILSQLGHKLQHISTLDIHSCAYLKRLDLRDWPSLQSVLIESCNKLGTCNIIQCPNVKQLHLKWCSMVHTFQVSCPLLDDCCTTGTNFANFTLESESLQNLVLNGITISPDHILHICCPSSVEISFNKCDYLSSESLLAVIAPCINLTKLHLSSCHNISHLDIPESLQVLTLSSLRRLEKITMSWMSNLKILHLCALSKVTLSIREQLLFRNQESLQELHLRVLHQEENLVISLPNLISLVLDQGLCLESLDLDVPKLSYLRIQGCPRLLSIRLHVDELSCLGIDHVTPMASLTSLFLISNTTKQLTKVLSCYVPNVEKLILHIKDLYVNLGFLKDLVHKLPNLRRIFLKDCKISHWLRSQKTHRLELDLSEGETNVNDITVVEFS